MISNPRPQTLEQVKTLIRRDLKLGAADVPDDMPFFGGDIDLDSLDILLLMTSIEKHFNVKVPSETVGKQVFVNALTLAAYVDEQLAGGNGRAPAAPAPSEAGSRLERLPHKDPFRFISRVVSIQENQRGRGAWAVTGAEAFFAGHFPGEPIVPGVLIAEALAQLSGLVGTDNGSHSGKLAHIDIRFERPVVPPTEIILDSRLVRTMGELQLFEVSAEVSGVSVARGTLTLNRPAGGEVVK
ncbi:MAG TPA: phosphopantetheine-binding protein [Tepidisphaeraceae bacterium]|jgi:3-hydroxyacyl-[acyl-carrier-protein] dehydratase|nr:phosphopantetheine-binding protein [Tepidisphaeraceae bacterium]